MSRYDELKLALSNKPKTWLISGVAGFIGSHLLQTLLELGQDVKGVDNFATGYRENLDDVKRAVGDGKWRRFQFIEGDITDGEVCREALREVNTVLHQAALGSVPRSVEDPLCTNRANVTGFLELLWAVKQAGIKRFVYASSSSVYGDEPNLPKREDRVGEPLSPYAASKRADELYATSFSRVYDLEIIGLRYFNIFGPRQDPQGPYAAVIPKWISLLRVAKPCIVYGDGKTTRDFCYVANAVQANILAGCVEEKEAFSKAYNIAVGAQTSLAELHQTLARLISKEDILPTLDFGPSRAGDVRHSLADITLTKKLLGYTPTHSVQDGLAETVRWYLRGS